jgi:hypothetical protein
LFDRSFGAFDVDLDLTSGVPDDTVEPELIRETPNERPKANPLHDSPHDDRAFESPGSLYSAHRTAPIGSIGCSDCTPGSPSTVASPRA